MAAFLLLMTCVTAHRAAAEERAEVLVLANGTRLEGSSGTLTNGNLEWHMPHGSELVIPLGEIERLDYLGDKVLPASAQTGPLWIPDPTPPPFTETDPWVYPWNSAYDWFDKSREYVFSRTKRISIGGRFMEGNTDQDIIDLAAQVETVRDNMSSQLTLTGEYGRSNNDTIANEWTANSTTDFSKEGKWLLYVTSLNEYDEFENLDYRGTLSGGVGYRFHNTKTERLIVRVGPAVTHEIYDDPSSQRFTADVFGEVESQWPVFKTAKFEHRSTLRPSIDDIGVFRLLTNSGILFPLDQEKRWMFKLGFKLEYNSQPNDGRFPTDYTTNASLVFTPK